MAKGTPKHGDRDLATNRAAAHEYFFLARLEAGIALTGSEVKSIREGRIQLKEAYASVRNGEVFLHGAHISPYGAATHDLPDPVRTRKLLLHAREIRKLAKETEPTGITIVPTRVYLKDGRIKVEIAVARGKRVHDKRDTLQAREAEREIDRAARRRR